MEDTTGSCAETAPEQQRRLSPDQAEQLVLRLIADHADSLLRVARRHSICADDAQDAYQRGLELLVRHAWRLDPDRAVGWLHTVVRREAVALNRSRRRYLTSEEADVDGFEAGATRSPEDVVIAFERVERSAVALKQLKPQELRALWLRALGYSYEEICARTEWTYTKVNRCLAEGRRAFLERYAGIEAGDECRRLAPQLSAFVDGEAPAAAAAELRTHLRHCRGCRAVVGELRGSARALAAVFPPGGLAVSEIAEPATHVAMRLYEALTVALNDRAAQSLLRAQAVVDAVGGTKAAAVASAALAASGGGLAVSRAVEPGAGTGRAVAALAPAPDRAAAATRSRTPTTRARTDRDAAGPRLRERERRGPTHATGARTVVAAGAEPGAARLAPAADATAATSQPAASAGQAAEFSFE